MHHHYIRVTTSDKGCGRWALSFDTLWDVWQSENMVKNIILKWWGWRKQSFINFKPFFFFLAPGRWLFVAILINAYSPVLKLMNAPFTKEVWAISREQHVSLFQTLFLVLLVQNTLEKYFFVLGSFQTLQTHWLWGSTSAGCGAVGFTSMSQPLKKADKAGSIVLISY